MTPIKPEPRKGAGGVSPSPPHSCTPCSRVGLIDSPNHMDGSYSLNDYLSSVPIASHEDAENPTFHTLNHTHHIPALDSTSITPFTNNIRGKTEKHSCASHIRSREHLSGEHLLLPPPIHKGGESLGVSLAIVVQLWGDSFSLEVSRNPHQFHMERCRVSHIPLLWPSRALSTTHSTTKGVTALDILFVHSGMCSGFMGAVEMMTKNVESSQESNRLPPPPVFVACCTLEQKPTLKILIVFLYNKYILSLRNNERKSRLLTAFAARCISIRLTESLSHSQQEELP